LVALKRKKKKEEEKWRQMRFGHLASASLCHRKKKYCQKWKSGMRVAASVTRDRYYDFEIYWPNSWPKNWPLFVQNNVTFCKIRIITLVFKKNEKLFTKNCRKSQKIVIIASTPGWEKLQNKFSNIFN
jgi:hypothetical protein